MSTNQRLASWAIADRILEKYSTFCGAMTPRLQKKADHGVRAWRKSSGIGGTRTVNMQIRRKRLKRILAGLRTY